MRRTIKRSAPRVIRAFYVNAFLHYSPFPFSFPIASSYISNAALKSLFQASIVWYFMLTFQSGLNCKFLGVLLYYINYLITVHIRVYSVCTFVRQLLTRLQLPKISGRYFPLNWILQWEKDQKSSTKAAPHKAAVMAIGCVFPKDMCHHFHCTLL